MSAYLYYHCDSPVLSDGDFDKLCKTCADNWDRLEPIRQWQLGSAEQIRATGMHCKVTTAAENGARAWHKEKFGKYPEKGKFEVQLVDNKYGHYQQAGR